METPFLLERSEGQAGETEASAQIPPAKDARPFFSLSSFSPAPTKLSISETTKNNPNTPNRSLRSSLFTHAEAARAQFRGNQFSSPSQPLSTPVPPSALSSPPKNTKESDVLVNSTPNPLRTPQQRQSKIMTKSEKLALKGAPSDIEMIEDSDMTIGLAQTTGLRFSLPSQKKRKGAAQNDDSGTVLFGSKTSHPAFPTQTGISKDIIEESFEEIPQDRDNDSVHFEDDVDGLIERHKQYLAQNSVGDTSNAASSSDTMDVTPPSDLILSESGKLPVVRVPAVANAKLFDYQREGVRFLYNLFISDRGGILADDMGLGKTVQTICFVMAIKSAQAAQASFFSSGSSSSTEMESEYASQLFKPIAKKPILIVSPASLLQHWHREFYQWTKLRTFIAHGKPDSRAQVIENAKQNKLDVVLISYDTLHWVNGVQFSCVIFDEAHKVKTRTSKMFSACLHLRAKRKYGLTGTVMQNSFEELWNLCHVLGFATTAIGDFDYFKKHYIAPIKEGHVQDASNAQISRAAIVASSLVEKLSRFILRRTKQCISHQLPPKEDHIVFCAPTDLQLRIYKRITDSPLYRLLRQNSIPCNCGSGQPAIKCCSRRPKALEMQSLIDFQKVALPALTRLQQLANHVSLIVPEDLIQQLQANAVLKRKFSESWLSTKSQLSQTGASETSTHQATTHPKTQSVDAQTQSHLITNFFAADPEAEAAQAEQKQAQVKKQAKVKTLRPSFPSIPASAPTLEGNSKMSGNGTLAPLSSLIDSSFLKMAFGEDIEEIATCLANGDEGMELCGKLKVLSSLLPLWHAQGAKVLLFSSSTRLMDILANFCTKHQFKFGRVEGSTPINQRQALVDTFNKTKAQFIFIVSTKACGVGLNLSSANVVVIFEPHFNVSLDMQASDRAHRIGQVRTTRVYRLVSAFTIEELTYRRQIYKQQMANIATEGRSEKRFFKMTEVFGAHLLFSLLDRSQLNTVDILERGNTFGNSNPSNNPQSEREQAEEGKFRVTRDVIADAMTAHSGDKNALFQLIMNKAAPANDGLGLDEDPMTANELGSFEKDDSGLTSGSHLETAHPLDQSETVAMDEILKRAGALHSHLNSELFSNTEDLQKPVTVTSLTPSGPPNTNRLSSVYLEPLPSAALGSIRSTMLSEDMEHLSPAFIGDAGARRPASPVEEFPDLM
jgi:SNF2 family DNA or RNA helicase